MQILQETHTAQRDEVIGYSKGVIRMGDSAKTEKAPKKSWFTGLKSEFKKIIWPDRKTLATQTTAVVVVSIAVGILIAVLDYIIQFGLNFLIG